MTETKQVYTPEVYKQLYSTEVTPIDDEALAFLSEYCKNPNLNELRNHVIKVKEDVSKLHVYICIERNNFLLPRIDRYPAYEKLVLASKEHTIANSLFRVADIGCCFGTDTRKLVFDGVHRSSIYSIDVNDGYWNLGFEMFGDKDILKVNTLFTDVSAKSFGEEHSDLTNKFNFVYTGAVLHVFAKDEAEQFVQNIYNLLVSGGTYFGSCATALEATQTTEPTPKKDKLRYLHSPESLEELLKSVGFTNVQTTIIDRPTQRQSLPGFPAVTKFASYSATKP